jgi:hypothetical protein
MVRRIAFVASFSLMALLTITSDHDVSAHATCTSSDCCSPHGEFSSQSGCAFDLCGYNISIDRWYRTIHCNGGTSAATGLSCGSNGFSGSAQATSAHVATTTSGRCCDAAGALDQGASCNVNSDCCSDSCSTIPDENGFYYCL